MLGQFGRKVFSDAWIIYGLVSCLPRRVSGLLFAFTLCLAVFEGFPTPSVQGERNDFFCAYSLSAPAMDGSWTSEREWIDATEFNVTEGGSFCIFRLKHDGYRLFVLTDIVFATSFTGMYTEVLVGVDVNGQGGVAPQDDDYLFRMLFTSESYGIVETLVYSQGNGVAWAKPKYYMKISPVAGFGVGNYSQGSDPYSSYAHWVCEMEISLSFLGAREAYDFFISAYNSNLGTLYSLPRGAVADRPETWGRIVGLRFPDLAVTKIWVGDASGKWIFPKPGQEYYFWALVENNGTASASGCKLSFRIIYEDHPQRLEAYCGFVESSVLLHPAQNQSFALYVPPMYSWLRRLGAHQVKAAVNEDQSTPELDYENNELTNNFLVDYGYILTVRLPYRGITVRIDGRPCVSDRAGMVKEALLQGRHVLEVPGLAFPSYGTEITFVGFSDGYNAASRPFDLGDDTFFEARYSVRFLLEVESKYGSVRGAGWLSAGSLANLSIAPLVEFGNGTRMAFVRWILPGNVSHFEYVARVQMNGPKKVQVIWKRQFLLTVRSEFGSPRGEGWYDQGTIASFQVDEVWGVVIVHTFREWVGDVRAVTPKASVIMDSPKEVRALWSADYTRLYIVLAYVLAMVLFAAFIAYRVKRQRQRRGPPR